MTPFTVMLDRIGILPDTCEICRVRPSAGAVGGVAACRECLAASGYGTIVIPPYKEKS